MEFCPKFGRIFWAYTCVIKTIVAGVVTTQRSPQTDLGALGRVPHLHMMYKCLAGSPCCTIVAPASKLSLPILPHLPIYRGRGKLNDFGEIAR